MILPYTLLLVLSQICDMYTTQVFLLMGMTEGNCLVHKHGWSYVIGMKFVLVLFTFFLFILWEKACEYAEIPTWTLHIFALVMCVIGWYPTFHNFKSITDALMRVWGLL